MNLSILLLGITLLLVSIAAITYSSSDLRNTSAKRHKFFKRIRMFVFLCLVPIFLLIIGLNIWEISTLDFVTVGNSYRSVIYILSAIICLTFLIIFVSKPLNRGIELFRKQNRDMTKYTKAINTSRNGLVFVLVLVAVTLFVVLQ